MVVASLLRDTSAISLLVTAFMARVFLGSASKAFWNFSMSLRPNFFSIIPKPTIYNQTIGSVKG